MSLILDALKRAERERQSSENVTPIIEPVAQDLNRPEAVPEKHEFNWQWVLLLFIAGFILIWFFFIKESKIDSSIVITQPSIQIDHAVASQVSISQSSVAYSSNNITQSVTDLYQQASSSLPKVEDVQVVQLYAENATASPTLIDGQPIATASVEATNPFPDVNTQLPKNLRTTSEARRIIDTDAIRFDDLSFNQKQLFPSISYSQHNYLGNSASSVVINGELLRVGSRITADLTIEEILEDGVVFIFYHKKVSFKALSGWINM